MVAVGKYWRVGPRPDSERPPVRPDAQPPRCRPPHACAGWAAPTRREGRCRQGVRRRSSSAVPSPWPRVPRQSRAGQLLGGGRHGAQQAPAAGLASASWPVAPTRPGLSPRTRAASSCSTATRTVAASPVRMWPSKAPRGTKALHIEWPGHSQFLRNSFRKSCGPNPRRIGLR